MTITNDTRAALHGIATDIADQYYIHTGIDWDQRYLVDHIHRALIAVYDTVHAEAFEAGYLAGHLVGYAKADEEAFNRETT